MGMDLDNILAHSSEYITNYLDEYLKDVDIKDNESKGLVVTRGDNGYYLVKTKFHPDANAHMEGKGYIRLEDLINNITQKITHE